jgi:hypothetical protein
MSAPSAMTATLKKMIALIPTTAQMKSLNTVAGIVSLVVENSNGNDTTSLTIKPNI